MTMVIKPISQIIEHEETAGKVESSGLTYYQILLTGINRVIENTEKKNKGMKLLELINKMEPDEELASSIEEAMEENRKVKVKDIDL